MYTVGSICSGIEGASVAWDVLKYKFEWFAENAKFPSDVLNSKYPDIPNLGDMMTIEKQILNKKIKDTDLICGGTPCQAFSLAGLKRGLDDERGNLTLEFVKIIDANDKVRIEEKKPPTIIFWENVEGVLKDKTNAFGSFISLLAGFQENISETVWQKAGILRGPKRNVAWRVLDAKYFGVPQQRKRLYLVAGGKNFFPEEVLFEPYEERPIPKFGRELSFSIGSHKFEFFREYTDCLYSAYGTKWNGNAAAYNGSLFIVQNNRIRRLAPIECERLMGFPDNYTKIPGARRTPRYQAIGNSWAVPVVRWIGQRFSFGTSERKIQSIINGYGELQFSNMQDEGYWNLNVNFPSIKHCKKLNISEAPNEIKIGDMTQIVSTNVDEQLYISPVGCFGILRRKNEKNLNMNKRLEEILINTSTQMSLIDIEKISRRQKRGQIKQKKILQESLF